jgi:uncharacterized membrane protein YfcA
MLTRERLAGLSWFAVLVAAFGLCAIWALAPGAGEMQPRLVVAFAMTAILLVLAGRVLSQWLDPRVRYERKQERLAGPRPGARLPR